MPELTGQRKFLRDRDARCLTRAKALIQSIFNEEEASRLDRTMLRLYPDLAAEAHGERVAHRMLLHYSRIRSLPSREWHGRTLYLVPCICCGKRRGVPEYLLWHLVDPTRPICEYCARSSRVPEFASAAQEGAE